MEKLLTEKMFNAIEETVEISKITEIRVRLSKQLVVYCLNKPYFVLNPVTKRPYIVDDFDITYILDIASGHSVYAVTEQVIRGYLTYSGGIRIGVIGEGVYVGNSIKNVKNINGLVIRIPHQAIGMADGLLEQIFKNNTLANTLIVSPPSAGKTTLIREIARNISNAGLNTLIIDERNEIAGIVDGKPTLDVGVCSDVATFMDKKYAYESVIRAMNPDVIVTDELFEKDECEALYRASVAGVKVLATIHADSVEKIREIPSYIKLFDVFQYFVLLDREHIGEIKQIIRADRYV